MAQKHTCQAVVISCIDFRFVEETNNHIKSLGLKNNFDHIKVAGAALALAGSGNKICDYILGQLEICVNKHQAKKVYIINHEDCGAYGGKSAFGSDKVEFAKHLNDMEKARGIIRNRFPGVEVELYWLALSKKFKQV